MTAENEVAELLLLNLLKQEFIPTLYASYNLRYVNTGFRNVNTFNKKSL